MKEALAIFRFLRECARRDERAVLVTLTAVTGSAARAPGTHMAIAQSGEAAGSFSGGCIEAAVIAEAQDVLADGRARNVRFGAGSRYIDIRLPCGGGIDLSFVPDPPAAEIERACALLEERQPVLVTLDEKGPLVARRARNGEGTGWTNDRFMVRHDPTLRIVVMGHGTEPIALLRTAGACGAEAVLLSPDGRLVDEAARCGYPARQLRTPGRSDALSIDPWTGVIFLFHDHDWETELLLQVLEQQPIFIGAMGSRRTHAERCNRLIAAGAPEGSIDRIVGPIGLIHASRDAQTLAISIMAQVVQSYDVATAIPYRSETGGPKADNLAQMPADPSFADPIASPDARQSSHSPEGAYAL
jgi:xanthine dehydrogenase accessory factor